MVIEVSDLDEVMLYLTGKQLNHKEVVIEENNEYAEIMGGLQDLLCQRIDKIESELKKRSAFRLMNQFCCGYVNNKVNPSMLPVREIIILRVSYCFTANIMLRTSYYQEKTKLKYSGIF